MGLAWSLLAAACCEFFSLYKFGRNNHTHWHAIIRSSELQCLGSAYLLGFLAASPKRSLKMLFWSCVSLVFGLATAATPQQTVSVSLGSVFLHGVCRTSRQSRAFVSTAAHFSSSIRYLLGAYSLSEASHEQGNNQSPSWISTHTRPRETARATLTSASLNLGIAPFSRAVVYLSYASFF